MKIHNKQSLVCCFIAMAMLLPGCSVQNTESQSNNVGKTVSSSHVSEKKKDTSDYLLSSVKFYDADGTCTMDIMFEYNEEGKEVHRVQNSYNPDSVIEFFSTYPDAFTQQITYIDEKTRFRNQVDTTIYNKDHKIQSETSTDYREDGTDNIMHQTEYTYDKQGNLILKENHSTPTVGHSLNYIHKTEYTYDSAGNCLTEKQTSSSEGQEDKLYTDLEYQYDNKGNRIREISNIADEHTYSPILYEYNQEGQKVKESDYLSTAPDTLKQYFIYEYDANGNNKKYSRFSSENQLLSYAEYEYIKLSELQSKGKTTSANDRLYHTWLVDGTTSSTISFEFIDPVIGIKCEIHNFDIREQKEWEGGASSYAEITDNTMKISYGPDTFITFTYVFEADGSLKLKDESTGNIISLHSQ